MFKTLRAILAQNRRLEDLERRVDAIAQDLRRRELHVEDLSASLEYTQAEIKKLRGRVTGGLRKEAEEDGGKQPPVDINEAIRSGTFSLRRHRGTP